MGICSRCREERELCKRGVCVDCALEDCKADYAKIGITVAERVFRTQWDAAVRLRNTR